MSNIDAINEAAEKYANDRYEELYKTQNLKEFSDTTRLSDFTDGINEGFIAGCKYAIEQFKAEQKQSADIDKDKLFEIRNRLYDNIPSHQINAFELISIISQHLKELDKLIDATPQKQLSNEDGLH